MAYSFSSVTLRLQQRELDLDEARRQVEILSKEKDLMRRKVAKLEEEEDAKAKLSPALTPTRPNISEAAGGHADHPRMAERKRIRKISSAEKIPSKEDYTAAAKPIDFSKVTGADLSKLGVRQSASVGMHALLKRKKVLVHTCDACPLAIEAMCILHRSLRIFCNSVARNRTIYCPNVR